jgi:hypothetical protein
MRTKRPTSVLVIAIFHFVFGGLGLLCGLPALVMQASGMGRVGAAPPAGATQQQIEMQEMQVRVQQRTEQEAPLQKTLAPINMVINLLLSLVLVVAGFGLVKMLPWGWWGSVVYAAASILMQIYLILFNLLYSMPIGGRILDEELKSRPTLQPLAGFLQLIIPLAIGLAVLGLIYPTIVLIVMSRPKVRAAFRGESADADNDDNFDGAATDRRGRREDEYDEEPRGGGEPDDRFGPAR